MFPDFEDCLCLTISFRSLGGKNRRGKDLTHIYGSVGPVSIYTCTRPSIGKGPRRSLRGWRGPAGWWRGSGRGRELGRGRWAWRTDWGGGRRSWENSRTRRCCGSIRDAFNTIWALNTECKTREIPLFFRFFRVIGHLYLFEMSKNFIILQISKILSKHITSNKRFSKKRK